MLTTPQVIGSLVQLSNVRVVLLVRVIRFSKCGIFGYVYIVQVGWVRYDRE